MSQFEETLKKDRQTCVGMSIISFFGLGGKEYETENEYNSLEIVPTLGEILTRIKNVEKWSKPTRPPFTINFLPMYPMIWKEVSIISPFNYPLFLTLGPLACKTLFFPATSHTIHLFLIRQEL